MTTSGKCSGGKLFANSHSTVSQSKQSQHDINCINFSKLSINSRKDLIHANNNSSTTVTGNTMSSSIDDRNYRPLLPRIDFPSAQFDTLLRMDSKELNKSWKQTTDNNKNKNCNNS